MQRSLKPTIEGSSPSFPAWTKTNFPKKELGGWSKLSPARRAVYPGLVDKTFGLW
jgi:hypothetical protein